MRLREPARQKFSIAVAYQNALLERSFAVMDACISWLTNIVNLGRSRRDTKGAVRLV